MTVPELEPWGSSALTEKVFCEYLSRRETHWAAGTAPDVYFHELGRHVLDLRLLWEGYPQEAQANDVIEALCAIRFTVDGLMCELLKVEYNARQPNKLYTSSADTPVLSALWK
jgi:hypothetical protein